MDKRKKYFIIIISALFLVIIAGLFFIFRPRFDSKKNIGTNISDQQAIYAKLDLDEKNYGLAQEKKDARYCQELSVEDSRSLCLQELARSSLSTSTCLLIGEQTARNTCLDGVTLNKIISSKNLAGCESLPDYFTARDCVDDIAQADKDTDCLKISDNKLQMSCLTIISYNKAKEKKDSALCLDIPDLIVRANCLSELNDIDLHSDADKDGLDFLQETLNGTDPNKADTDGDSYPDKAEVKEGFNPDGRGKAINYEEKCSDIAEPEIKESCSKEFISGVLDYSRCDSIKDPDLSNYCLKKHLDLQGKK